MTLEITPLSIPDILLVRAPRYVDHRGSTSETYSKRSFSACGLGVEFVQDLHSHSRLTGTIRGLHFQKPPFSQHKLVRVLRGRIFDVAVDIRRSSPTFGKHVAVELSEATDDQLFIPIGFAHGFCTLEPDTTVFYKLSEHYSPEHDRGIRWNDPEIGIDWPAGKNAELSQKDSRQPYLRDIADLFD